MPEQNLYKWLRKTFQLGANRDLEPDSLTQGQYWDMRDKRIQSVEGTTGSAATIGGEQVKYPAGGQDSGYFCIGSASVGGRIIEFCAHPDAANFPPYVRVAGVIMAQSPNIPYTFDHPLQIAPNEECTEGRLFPADANSIPLFWDIGDMITNYNGGTGAYFGNYTTNLNSVILKAPPEFPVHRQIDTVVFVGGAGGLPTGQYRYALRWDDASGNRTNISPFGPLIDLPQGLQLNSYPTSMYPGGRTYGGDPGILAPTGHGIKMEFRVDNRIGAFASVEIIRQRFNDAGGLLSPGVIEVVGRIPLFNGQFSIQEFIDPVNSNILEVIPPDEAALQNGNFTKPKSPEYADGRITYANLWLYSSIPTFEFRLQGGVPAFPITKELTRYDSGFKVADGYDNPWQSYNKSFARGDKYGIGIQGWRADYGKLFVQSVPGFENYEFPNRGDIKSGDSLLHSYGECWASNTDTQGADRVTPTYESVTQGITPKVDTNSNINVSAPGVEVNRWAPYYNAFGPPGGPPGETNLGLIGGQPFYSPTSSCYKPWDPRDNQAASSGYLVPPNLMRLVGPIGSSGQYAIPSSPPSLTQYTPQVVQGGLQSAGAIFAPTVNALGIAIAGVENIPEEVGIISMVRTDPADQVICEGYATYSVGPPAPSSPATKSTNSFWCDFPDMASGLVPQAVIDDIKANPQNYGLRAVRPLGFYTEIYGYSGESWPGFTYPPPSMMARAIDMISYPLQEDHGQVNPGETGIGGMGVQPALGSPAPPGNYVDWGNWRTNNITNGGDPNVFPDTYNFWRTPGNDGNTLMSIALFGERISEKRGTTYFISTDNYLYTPSGNSTGGQTGFHDPNVRRFHQPTYMVQLIRTGANVPQDNSTPYRDMAQHIKVKSTIGLYADPALVGDQQDFRLVGERWEDCIGRFDTDYRYAYVQPPGQPEQRYICITGNTQINIATILTDISMNGFWIAPDGLPVYGVYEGVIDNNQFRYLRFGILGIIPPTGSALVVKYDSTAVWEGYGADRTIAPCTMGMVDREVTRDSIEAGDNQGLQLRGLPTPYAGWMMNPRYFMPEKGAQTEEQIVIDFQSEARQWIVMYNCETRIQPAMLVNSQSVGSAADQSQVFPHIHYVIRAYNDIAFDTNGAGNGFFPQYDADYPGEVAIWRLGGIRFVGGLNFDYMKQPPIEFQGTPKSGYQERLHLCTGKWASNVLKPSQQDTANNRTFLSANLIELSEETGEIKLIASTNEGLAGADMYAWTEKGFWRTPTNKNTLASVDGNLVARLAIDGYWGTPQPISRTIGMPDELWRLWAKGPAINQGQSRVDTFFWADRNTFYRSTGGRPDDIARDKYLTPLLPALQGIANDFSTPVTGVFDSKYNEYLGSIDGLVYVFSSLNNAWSGIYTYNFDKYQMHQGVLQGFRDATTWNLDVGDFINGSRLDSWVDTPVIPQPGLFMEVMRHRVHGDKPTILEVYDADHVLMCQQSQALQEAFAAGTGPFWVKLYDGWETDIDRVLASYDPSRKLAQGMRFFVRIHHDQRGHRVILYEAQAKHIQ